METAAPRVDTGYDRSRDTGSERPAPGESRSLVALFSDLFRETSTLVHQEAELAKAEMSEKVSEVGKGAAAIAIGGAVIFAGFIILLIAASNGLALMLPEEHANWLAPLIIGLAVMVVGFIALGIGKHELSSSNLQPSRTMESLRRDSQLVKEHVS
jgi:hypothetical protein